MRFSFILIFVIALNSYLFSQNIENTTNIGFLDEYKAGAYLSFEEFKSNAPSIVNIVVNEKGSDSKPYVKDSLGSIQKIDKAIWGYSDGKAVYINVNKLPGTVGNAYFELVIDYPYSISNSWMFYIIKMETGKIKALDFMGGWSINGFKKLFKEHKDLYKKYKEEHSFTMDKPGIVALKTKYVLLLNEKLKENKIE